MTIEKPYQQITANREFSPAWGPVIRLTGAARLCELTLGGRFTPLSFFA
jgi:hypothetical protein